MGVLANRVRVNTTTTGTGTITLGSAVAGYQTFTAGGITDGQVVSYVIVDNGNAWEVGEGTYGAGGNTLTRTVTESSNSDAALNLSGGAQVFIAARAEDISAQAQGVWNTGTATQEGVISPAKLSGAVAALTPFSKEYTSAEQTITQAGLRTLAHGFSAVPKLIQYRLVCKTAEHGYSVDDVVDILSGFGASFASSAVAYSFSTILDATNITIRYGNKSSGTIAGINATTGNLVEFTNSSWRLVVRAWA